MSKIGILLLLLLCLSGVACATEQFAEQTGQDCGYCHLDPSGGGELTPAGDAFVVSQAKAGTPVAPSGFGRVLRFLVGYLHLLTAVFWFGTIFYVHLVLKPAYASKGLPRGEVRVGLASMAIMAVTGLYLSWVRLESWSTLFDTRFGQLLLVKVGLYLLMTGMGLLAVFVIGPRLQKKREAQNEIQLGDMDAASLARCDGKEGRPACFAYRGRIYDASNSPMWKDGEHMRRHDAGADLTEVLSQAPHGEDCIMRLPDVGALLETSAGTGNRPKKQFFFLAYLNLGLALAILLVVALWRWA